MNLIMATLLICILSNATLVKSKLSHCSETFNLSSVCRLTNDYNPSLSPEYPSKIQIYFNILGVANLDWTQNTITLFIDLWTKWNETRITLNDENLHNETYREANPWKKWVLVNTEVMDEIFFPKLTFQNIKSIEKQPHYGARELHYYWMGWPHQLEYRSVRQKLIIQSHYWA